MRKKYSHIEGKLVSKFLYTFIIVCLIIGSFGLNPVDTNASSEDEQMILVNIQEAIQVGSYFDPRFADRISISDVEFDNVHQWALVDIYVKGLNNGGGNLLAKRTNAGWEVAFPREEAFRLWIEQFPDDLVSKIDLLYLMRISSPETVITQTPQPVSGFSFPWMASDVYQVTADVTWHIDNENVRAYDFGLPEDDPEHNLGGTPVIASKSGTVLKTKYDSHIGGCDDSYIDDANYVEIDHGDGTVSVYAHLEPRAVVQEGENVVRGQLIGYSGHTGNTCGITGAHLHFVVRDKRSQIQPWGDINSTHVVLFDNPYGPPGQPNPVDPTYPNRYTSNNKTPGVILYEHSNFAGYSFALYDSDSDLCDNPLDPSQPPVNPCFSAPSWNDVASSIKVSPGYQAWLYLHSEKQEKELGEYSIFRDCNSDISDFSDPSWNFPNGASLNDNVSRVIIDKCSGGEGKDNLFNSLFSPQDDDPCTPDPPPTSSDDATFISHITLPNGTVVSPSQVLVKTWRMKNTGSSTWGSGYQLAFVGSEQMGAPQAVNVPTTSPGQEIDISVPLTAPSEPGEHVGRWQLRNPQGTYFGDVVWVRINVSTPNPGGNITLFDISPASPSEAISVHVVGRARYFTDFRSMRFVIGNEVHEMSNFQQIGDQNEISFDWNTASLPRGNYAIIFEVAKNGDPDWVDAERQIKTYTLIGTPAPTNRPPDRPQLKSPYNWFLKDASGSPAPVELCVYPASDPDNNTVQYYFEVKDQGGGVYGNSGWTTNACWTRNFDPNTYSWRVKTGDGSAESDWSTDTWNFTVAKGGVYIGDHTIFSPDTNETHVCVFVTYDGIQGPEVYAWLNKAPDGSESGEWRLLDHYGPNTTPDCTQPNYHGFWIRSPEYETGNHKLRISAVKRDSGANASKDTFYNISYIRPSDVNLLAPSTRTNNGTWWNTRTIHFEWSPSLRAENYTLRVSTYSNPWTDPSPLLNQVVGSGTTSYDHTFSQDYAQLYWSVRASNSAGYADSGGDVWFGIDLVEPTCQIQDLPATTYENIFQVNWSGTDNSAGVRSFDVQYRDSDRGEWRDWLVNAPANKPYELFTGQPGHTYYFRCRSTDNAGNSGQFPAEADTFIKVDPASRPPSPWWNDSYSYKRNLTILNNMSNIAMPVGYPVRLHFDSGTVPTSEELYNASLSSTKCDDLRIVQNNSTELDRLIENCAANNIDIRFSTQISIPAGSIDNTSYQLYYGNSGATNPPKDPRKVWSPVNDNNTVGLWYLSEGTGSTSIDLSGYGNNITTLGTLSWASSDKFGNALSNSEFSSGPPGAFVQGNPSLSSGAFTFEAFVKRYDYPYGIIAAQGENCTNCERWAILLQDRRLRITVWPAPDAGASEFLSASEYLTDTNWHHIAVTFDGDRTAKFYRDGALTDTGLLSQSGIRFTNYNLYLGSGFQPSAERFYGLIDQVRLSNIVRDSFPHGVIAKIINEPSLAAGEALTPPTLGSADLKIISVTTYPNSSGGVIVQAMVQNQGDLSTLNGFYTDLYLDHVPVGPEDYTGSLKFWVNDPIEPGQTLTLTSVITDLPGARLLDMEPASQVSGMLYAQVDSTGALNEPDEDNNLFSQGTPICIAAQDAFENDNTPTNAVQINLGQTQIHNFDRLGDQDWVKFQAEEGRGYSFSTFDLGATSDTYLYLYDTDGITLLASNDDFNGSLASRIDWTAPATGRYYILIRHWNPNVGGCETIYSLKFEEVIQPTIQFEAAFFNIGESAGEATIQVKLSAVSSDEVTVDYATSDGTAISGDDYTAASGTLIFMPGETLQAFTINVLNDALIETDETVNLSLSNPVNADLGSLNTAILRILDDETYTIKIYLPFVK